MIKEFEVENFRCFKELQIGNLKSLNIIIGKNNVGKTALLEAIFLHIGSNNPELSITIDSFRGIESYELNAESLWGPLFYNLQLNQKIKFSSIDRYNNRRRLEIILGKANKTILDKKKPKLEIASTQTDYGYDRLIFNYFSPKNDRYTSEAVIEYAKLSVNRSQPKDLLRGMFVSSHASGGGKTEADRYSALDIKGEQQIVLEILKIIEPRLKRLSVITQSSHPMIYGDIGIGSLIPIPYLGEGISKLLTITLAMSEVRGGVVLIDEMDRGLHYSIINNTLESLVKLMNKFQIQVFLTTHSLEFIAHINDTFSKIGFNDYQIIRLDKTQEIIKPTYYDSELIKIALEDNWDFR